MVWKVSGTMIDREGIQGHQLFLNNVIIRLMSGGDAEEESVQLYSLRENLLYEDRNLSATCINSAIYNLKLALSDPENSNHLKLKAVGTLNKAIIHLPMVAI